MLAEADTAAKISLISMVTLNVGARGDYKRPEAVVNL